MAGGSPPPKDPSPSSGLGNEAFDEVLTGEREPRNEQERQWLLAVSQDLLSERPLSEGRVKASLGLRILTKLRAWLSG